MFALFMLLEQFRSAFVKLAPESWVPPRKAVFKLAPVKFAGARRAAQNAATSATRQRPLDTRSGLRVLHRMSKDIFSGAATDSRTEPADLHDRVENFLNSADPDGLVGLYEPTAVLLGPEGETAEGRDEIRAAWEATIALGGRTKLVTKFAVITDDVALLSNDWTMEGEGWSTAATTAEVARRQPDGTWRYVIDNPFFSAPVTT